MLGEIAEFFQRVSAKALKVMTKSLWRGGGGGFQRPPGLKRVKTRKGSSYNLKLRCPWNDSRLCSILCTVKNTLNQHTLTNYEQFVKSI